MCSKRFVRFVWTNWMMLALMNGCITSVVKLQPIRLHLIPSPVASSSSFLSRIYGLPRFGNSLTLTRSKKSLACLVLPRLVPRCCVFVGITSLSSCGGKVRMCCDGSKRAASELRFAQTYVSCIDQPCMRLFFVLSAAMGFVVMGADCTSAYTNSRRLPKRHTSGLTKPMPIGIALAMESKLTARWYYQCSRPFRDTRKPDPLENDLPLSYLVVCSVRYAFSIRPMDSLDRWTLSMLLFVWPVQDVADAHAMSSAKPVVRPISPGWFIPGQVRGATLTS
jgi:hypothetical protein